MRAVARAAKDIHALKEWAERNGSTVEVEGDEGSLPLTVIVTLPGPADSLYENGVYRVKCNIASDFPVRPPAVAFLTPIWHPNIEPTGGSVCLDILKTRWTPVIRLHDLFESYLPQLLQHAEPDDPFNSTAAAMMSTDIDTYNSYTRSHTMKHAVAGNEDIVLPVIRTTSGGSHHTI